LTADEEIGKAKHNRHARRFTSAGDLFSRSQYGLTPYEEINMRNQIEDRRVLKMQFEAFANNAKQESGRSEAAYCFDALSTSVDKVSPELLEVYVEMFQKAEHRKIGRDLRLSIERGGWSPTDATEYMERFIALASGTGPNSKPSGDGTQQIPE
jgi:hypothetical protein